MSTSNGPTPEKTGQEEVVPEAGATEPADFSAANMDNPPDAGAIDESLIDDTIEAGLSADEEGADATIAEELDTEEPDTDTDTDTEPDEAPEAGADETIAQLEMALAEAEGRANGYLDKLQRTAAEFQNSKRRQEKQLADAIERAGTQMIMQMLPILDDLDLAFQNLPEGIGTETDAWLGGFEQIQKKLLDLLHDQGVVVIEDSGIFDPNRHEAVMSEPSDEVESGHITATLRTGYELKGRVLRPALVRVAM